MNEITNNKLCIIELVLFVSTLITKSEQYNSNSNTNLIIEYIYTYIVFDTRVLNKFSTVKPKCRVLNQSNIFMLVQSEDSDRVT